MFKNVLAAGKEQIGRKVFLLQKAPFWNAFENLMPLVGSWNLRKCHSDTIGVVWMFKHGDLQWMSSGCGFFEHLGLS